MMTVQEWRDAVESRVKRRRELVVERRAVAVDSVEGRKLKDDGLDVRDLGFKRGVKLGHSVWTTFQLAAALNSVAP